MTVSKTLVTINWTFQIFTKYNTDMLKLCEYNVIIIITVISLFIGRSSNSEGLNVRS